MRISIIGAAVFWTTATACVPGPDELPAEDHDIAGHVPGAGDQRVTSALAQVAYIKASNPDRADNFGDAVSLSGDTLVVGAGSEDSATTGINGNQADNSKGNAGAVYVFVRNGTTWSQQAYLKASNTDSPDSFGDAVAVSGDTVAVGAWGESSANGDQANNEAFTAGAVYVFVRNGTTWSQQAYLKASNIDPGDAFGRAIALSGDTLAVGAEFEQSAAQGINGNQSDNSLDAAGAVYVFQRTGQTWAQEAYIKASNTDAGDVFGTSVALSGNTLAVGAIGEASAATGANGNQNDNSVQDSGAVYVFQRTGQTWAQQAYLKASNPLVLAGFGVATSLSGDTLAVGANDGSVGAAYVFVRSGTQWTQQARLQASNPGGQDRFGSAVVISEDTLLVGAPNEDSIATGINGNQNDNTAIQAGAAYLFSRSAGAWTQQAYLKASNTELARGNLGLGFVNAEFGQSVAMFGSTPVVGASCERGGSAGINGNQAPDTSKSCSGAVYVFQQ
jgi:hypothetical protein